jgi:hypothetical protein
LQLDVPVLIQAADRPGLELDTAAGLITRGSRRLSELHRQSTGRLGPVQDEPEFYVLIFMKSQTSIGLTSEFAVPLDSIRPWESEEGISS